MEFPRSPQRLGRTLLDVLPSMGTTAEALIKSLGYSVQDARLAFKGLRDFIDNNVSELRLIVRPEHWHLWAAGQVASLDRWPACSRYIVNLMAAEEKVDEEAASFAPLVTLPFLGQAARQRITSLEVSEFGDDLLKEADIAYLAPLLPNLQHLHLHTPFGGMLHKPEALQLMHDSIASLRRLQSLTLPSFFELCGLDALGPVTTLTRLEVRQQCEQPEDLEDVPLGGRLIANVAALQHLRVLILHTSFELCDLGEDEAFPLLLNSLPQTLERLSVFAPCGTLIADLDSGRLRSISMSLPSTTAVTSCNGLAHALLSCRALGPQLQSLVLATLCLDGAASLGHPELQPLWALLRRCSRVEVGELIVESVAQAEDAVQRLGFPKRYRFLGPTIDISFQAARQAPSLATLGANAGQVAARSGSGGGGQRTLLAASTSEARLPFTLPTAAELSQAVRQHLVTGALEGCGTMALAAPGAAGPAAPAGHLLLLHGPMIAGLAQASEALKAWLLWLEGRAAAAAAAGNDAGGEAAAGPVIKYIYTAQVLPAGVGSPGLLVACRSAGAAAAVAAAAEAVAAGEGAAGALHVMALAWAPERYAPPSARSVLLTVLKQNVTRLWDRHVGSCNGSMEAELALLRSVMALWERLTNLSPLLRL